MVLAELDAIHRSYPNLNYQISVPCSCADCLDSPEPHLHNVESLKKAASLRVTVQCHKSFLHVDPKVLLESAIDQNLVETDPDPPAATERSDEVFVSYAWATDAELARSIGIALNFRGLKALLDRDQIQYKASVRAFMNRARDAGGVVLLLSDAYFQSASCMYELICIHDSGDFRNRVFPVVMNAGVVTDPESVLTYIEHWEAKIRELDGKMRRVEQSNLEGVREEIDHYRAVRMNIGEITRLLQDMNARSFSVQDQCSVDAFADAVAEAMKRRHLPESAPGADAASPSAQGRGAT